MEKTIEVKFEWRRKDGVKALPVHEDDLQKKALEVIAGALNEGRIKGKYFFVLLDPDTEEGIEYFCSWELLRRSKTWRGK